ncbi:hypothetical protein Pfo_008067 [Paulownia fortunei]|nr:hypothetical protein Pfo_008067 [Paulownia fortunei]
MENKHSVASDSSEKKKVVTLRSSDGEMFEVEKDVFMEFLTIKPMLEECSTDGDAVIPLLSITGQTLAKLPIRRSRPWTKKIINVDQKTLFDLILASNFLNVKSLLDLTCKTVAEMMRGRTPEEIRKTFHIKNDYTSEEEAEVRRENHWAFE